MDHILYRKEKIPTMTLKKGTLLFRYTKDSKTDLRGIPIDENHTCLNSNYNVFFHPNPFVGKAMLYQFRKFDTIHVYRTLHDLNIIKLLKPSKYTRGHRHSSRSFITSCSKTRKGCFERKPKSSDPCFSKTIIEKYPDIVGMIGFAKIDADALQKTLDSGYIKPANMKYFHFMEDANGVKSIPEIILYPLRRRNPKDQILENNQKIDSAYELLGEFQYDTIKLREFMEKTRFDPDTEMYLY